MGSRLVISGVGEDKFGPDRDITRAEFALIIVRGLGLMRSGSGKDVFNDVAKDAWYYDAVAIAYEYNLIGGYGNGQFGPMNKITRTGYDHDCQGNEDNRAGRRIDGQ